MGRLFIETSCFSAHPLHYLYSSVSPAEALLCEQVHVASVSASLALDDLIANRVVSMTDGDPRSWSID